jgi:GBP family porin
MKKMVVTWVVVAASAGSAYAQSSVKLSGSVYGGVGFNQGGDGVLRTSMTGPSSFMFSGKEDLGGGLSALFKFENGFNADSGSVASATTFFDKQAFVGLQGPWGTVRAGRVYTPSFATLALVADPSGTYSVLTSTNLMESHGVRMNNGVIYNTPGFDPWTYARSGIYGAVAHYFGESTDGTSRNSATGWNIGYGEGSLVVELSNQVTNVYTSAALDVDSRSTILAANYDFDVAKGYIAYADNSARNTVGGIKAKDNIDMLLGVYVPIGVGAVTVSYIRKDDKLPANNDASVIGATYDYFLSRRTKLTVGYAKLHKRNASSPQRLANSYTGTTAANGGTSAVTLGVTHRF